jgi:hypothetical protein
MTCTVETNVMGVTITSSPGESWSISIARCSAAVPEHIPTTCGTPMYWANSSSKSWVLGPNPAQPENNTSATASASC